VEFFLQVGADQHKGWRFEAPTELKWVPHHLMAEASPSQTLAQIADGVPAGQWQCAHWKTATGERHSTRLAWCEVWLQHSRRKAGGGLEKIWLVVDWPAEAAEPSHDYLAALHRPLNTARLLTPSRSRWHRERYFSARKMISASTILQAAPGTGFIISRFSAPSPTSLSSPSTCAPKKF